MNQTLAQKALELLQPIPDEEFITGMFTDGKRCCVLGHFTRLTSADPADYSYNNCADYKGTAGELRQLSEKYLSGQSQIEPSPIWLRSITNVRCCMANPHQRLGSLPEGYGGRRIVNVVFHRGTAATYMEISAEPDGRDFETDWAACRSTGCDLYDVLRLLNKLGWAFRVIPIHLALEY